MFAHFYNMLTEVLGRKNQSSSMLAVCCIDIDRFSVLVRDCGSRTGDRILQELEQRLCRWLGPKDFMAHNTGDQFYLCIDVQHQMAIFRQLQEQIELP
jgi:GGDEF domain-containing protein